MESKKSLKGTSTSTQSRSRLADRKKRGIVIQCDEVANCRNERSRGYIGIRRMEAAMRKTKDGFGGGGDRRAGR